MGRWRGGRSFMAGILVVTLGGLSLYGAAPSRRSRPDRSAALQQIHGRRSTTGVLYSKNLGIAVATDCSQGNCAARVSATGNLGRTWRDITPGHLAPGMVVTDHDFNGRRRGWVVANDCVTADAFVFRTSNGGRRWRRTRIDPVSCAAGATIMVDFVNRSHGWLEHIEPTGGSAVLRRTTDGGKTWSRARDLPVLGDTGFRNRKRGFLADYLAPANRLYTSKNSGRRWTRQRIARPQGYGDARLYFAIPTFHGGTGFLPITMVKDGRADIAFYVSRNGGRRWRGRLFLQIRARRRGGRVESTLPTSIADKRVWWVLAGRGPHLYITRNGGSDWSKRKADLPAAGEITAIGPKKAWASAFNRRKDQTFLYLTRNAGRSWTRLRPRG